MIDFRYHVVSLIAVFIALAVGIVLGAGPLRGQLSDTLEGQVADLATERTQLRDQVQHNERRAEAKDGLIDLLSMPSTEGVLEGIDVAVVQLPDGDTDLANDLVIALTGAGAESVTRVEVLPSWEDVDDGSDRADVVASIAAELGTTTTPEAVLAAVLGGTGSFGTDQRVGAAATRLELADLISVQETGDSANDALPGASGLSPHEAVVVLDGGLDAGRAEQDAEQNALVQERLDLVGALAGTPAAVCVVGAGTEVWRDPVADAEGPLVAAVRADGDLVDEVSTVDNLESAAGRLATTWAVARQVQGETGHYGLAADSSGIAPDPPPIGRSSGPPDDSGGVEDSVTP